MKAQGVFTIKCNSCGDFINISPRDANFDEVIDDLDNDTLDIKHTWSHSQNCPQYGHKIKINYVVTEGQFGKIKSIEHNISGAIVTRDFDFTFDKEGGFDNY